MAIGAGSLATAGVLAVFVKGSGEDAAEALALLLAPLGLFVLVEAYLVHRRRRLTGE